LIDQDAMSVAADALGYRGASEVIERDHLSVMSAYRMFLSGAGQDRGRVAAVIVLAAATARHHFQPDTWNGDLERRLAVAALDLDGDRRLLDHAAATACAIIQASLNATDYHAKRNRRDGRRSGLCFESLVPDLNGKRGASHATSRV
jgi:hypothetical protein